MLSRSVMSDFLRPMDCSLPGSSVHGDSPGKNTEVGCHALLQGVFPIQGSKPGLCIAGRFFYCLSHQESPLDIIYLVDVINIDLKEMQKV